MTLTSVRTFCNLSFMSSAKEPRVATVRGVQCRGSMPVRHFRELIAWQLATKFKLEAFRLLRGSPEAWGNYKYRRQLIEASRGVASNVVEGFLRKSPGDFCRFLDYSVSSLGEAEEHIGDGITLEYFATDSCSTLFRLGRRCLTAIIRLKQSQQRYIQEREGRRSPRSPKPKKR